MIRILLILVQMISLSAFAGGDSGGGGEAKKIRSLILAKKRAALEAAVENAFMSKDTYNNVTHFLEVFASGRLQIADAKNNSILQTMVQKGFSVDRMKTKFVVKAQCVDSAGVSKSAVAAMNKPGSDICINVKRIVDEFGPYIMDSDIIGLAMHEYAHHYGFLDEDHSFAAAAALAWQKDSEERDESLMFLTTPH